MTDKKFKIPRHMYWSTDLRDWRRCPKCDSLLENEYQSYLVIVKESGKVDQFVTGNDAGYFCPKCPVVVLDEKKFGKIVFMAKNTRSFAIAVTGIIDLDAVPEDKKHLPLGEDNNPIPLVEFINFSNEKEHKNFLKDKSVLNIRHDTMHSESEPGRNDPCPCGSGKKYKKCCLRVGK